MAIPRMNRRELLRLCGQGVALAPFASLLGCKLSKPKATGLAATPYQGTDEQLLEEIQRGSFQFFWNETNPDTGQVKDRALLNGGDTRTMSSIAATGFGLSALCIGDARGYAKTADIANRVRTTLRFLDEKTPNVHGFYYHFLDMNTGQRWEQVRVIVDRHVFVVVWSSDRTAIFSRCGNSRSGHKDIRTGGLAVDAEWREDVLDGMAPGVGISEREVGALLRADDDLSSGYRIADASGASGDMERLDATRRLRTRDSTYISGNDPIFTHQYSQAWFDFPKQEGRVRKLL